MGIGHAEALIFRPEFMNPKEPTGLWWCKDAEDVQTVSINAVCKSMMAEWKELDTYKEYVNEFPYILLAIPPGERQEEALNELQARFATPVIVPTPDSFKGQESLRDIVREYGIKALDVLLLNGVEVPAHGLINIADVDCTRKKDPKRVVSGIQTLDRAIGGFSPGELSVWTGKRGEGKSTLLGQVMLDAVNQNHVVCCYSGEMPKQQFKRSLIQQAAGRLNVVRREDQRSGRVFFDPKPEVVPYIDNWWNTRLFITDIQKKDAHDEENILKIFEYANRRYGADVFLVDNIMSAELKDEATLGF